MPEKPIGENGPLAVTSGTPASLAWNKIEFPKNKESQELMIAEAFAKHHCGDAEFKLTQLEQNDFDFRFQKAGKDAYLEPMEIMFPGKKRGPPYTERIKKYRVENSAAR